MNEIETNETGTEPSGNVIGLPSKPEAAAASHEPGRGGLAAFVHDHPGLVIAGGIAVGVVAGAFLHRGTRRRLTRSGTRLAELAGTSRLAFTRQALELATRARSDLHERREELTDRAEKLGEAAAERIERIGDTTRERVKSIVTPAEEAASKAGESVSRTASQIRSRLTR